MSDITVSLRDFLRSSPKNDDEVHAYAEKLGVDPHELEGKIYAIAYKALSGDYLKHANDDDSKFDANELAMGIKVEQEHIDDPEVAKKIAKAHLNEFPTYYTKLKAMEAQAKSESAFEFARYGKKYMIENVNRVVGKII